MSKITLTDNSIQCDQLSHAESKFENRIYFGYRIQKLKISGSNMAQFKGFYKLLIPSFGIFSPRTFSYLLVPRKGLISEDLGNTGCFYILQFFNANLILLLLYKSSHMIYYFKARFKRILMQKKLFKKKNSV